MPDDSTPEDVSLDGYLTTDAVELLFSDVGTPVSSKSVQFSEGKLTITGYSSFTPVHVNAILDPISLEEELDLIVKPANYPIEFINSLLELPNLSKAEVRASIEDAFTISERISPRLVDVNIGIWRAGSVREDWTDHLLNIASRPQTETFRFPRWIFYDDRIFDVIAKTGSLVELDMPGTNTDAVSSESLQGAFKSLRTLRFTPKLNKLPRRVRTKILWDTSTKNFEDARLGIVLRRAKQLVTADLSNWPLGPDAGKSIAGFNKLENLTLQNCGLTVVDAHNWPELKFLDLSDNANLGELKNVSQEIEKLMLRSCVELRKLSIGRAQKLKELDVSRCLRLARIQMLDYCRSLERIDLSYTLIDETVVDSLMSLENLSWVNVSNSPVDIDGIRRIAGLPNMQTIHVRVNTRSNRHAKISQPSIDSLQAEFPQIRIISGR